MNESAGTQSARGRFRSVARWKKLKEANGVKHKVVVWDGIKIDGRKENETGGGRRSVDRSGRKASRIEV